MMSYHEELAVKGYKEDALKALQISFPYVPYPELEQAVNWSINKRFKNNIAIVKNNYANTEDEVTLLDLTNYILDKQPIITPSGVMFKRHGEVPNPLVRMVERFLERRDEHKAEMFRYPRGSEMFELFNLTQILDKLDANGTYGVIGARTSIYFNIYVASSVTHQGMSAVSAAALLFESFLSNNVGFSSLNDIVTFISNVANEERHYNTNDIVGGRYISRAECFRKLIITCKFGYIPSEKDMNIVWNMLQNLRDEDIVRLYYKNNLYEFIENPVPMSMVVNMLTKLHLPYVNPNKVPPVIKEDLQEFWNVIKEFVYYDKQIIDRLGKMDSIVRNVSIIMDTDSAIISLDAWYRCILNHTFNIDMDIKHHIYDPFVTVKKDEFGDPINIIDPIIDVNPPLTYDFYTDEVLEQEVSVNRDQIVPQDGLRYSIINIMAYCITQMINDFMYKYVINSNALHPKKGCLFIMKNEFLFKTVLDTDGKKNYAANLELQEGNLVPKDHRLKITGMPIDKVGLLPAIKKQLQDILYNDVLNVEDVDQLTILKKLATVEKGIYNSILNGSKDYYKPVTIKALSSYDNPMSIQGIKASVVYNATKETTDEAIDLTARNSVDIIKCSITPKNVGNIAKEYPEVYTRLIELFKKPEFKTEISAIALPLNASVPKWLLEFVSYKEIINDNIKNFPLSAIGLSQTQNKAVNYTNILSI